MIYVFLFALLFVVIVFSRKFKSKKVCPICQASNIESAMSGGGELIVFFAHTCRNCGFKWNNINSEVESNQKEQ